MSYVENNLLKDEEILHRGQLHWINFGWPAAVSLFGLLALMDGGSAGFVILLFGLGLGGLAFLNIKNSEFVITNKRVVMKSGVIRRHSLETLLSKVEGIIIGETLLGRILGYGTIIVNGTGGTKEGFRRITQPMEFRKKLQEILDSKQ